MAQYRSYRKIVSDQLAAGSITAEKLAAGVGPSYCVKHIFGHPCYCTPGCCCYWTVPAGVGKVTWEVWGAGGNGSQFSNRGARGREGVVVVHEFYG